jgi:hypothetical protein
MVTGWVKVRFPVADKLTVVGVTENVNAPTGGTACTGMECDTVPAAVPVELMSVRM